ncbi:hypothetical protein EV44_g0225 [Erysiphe necator]|uniref:Uncharacterized protein n=1 Tax=Uncinula necator TaxID=52586 RepID=A0A0B1P0Y0_UNCNE|nr:hypothetical protein EV44_g0225 [Erysiphe necator]
MLLKILTIICLFISNICLAFSPISLTIKWESRKADCQGIRFDEIVITKTVVDACEKERSSIVNVGYGGIFGTFITLQNYLYNREVYSKNGEWGPEPVSLWIIHPQRLPNSNSFRAAIRWDKDTETCHYFGIAMYDKSKKNLWPCHNT